MINSADIAVANAAIRGDVARARPTTSSKAIGQGGYPHPMIPEVQFRDEYADQEFGQAEQWHRRPLHPGEQRELVVDQRRTAGDRGERERRGDQRQ